MSLFSDLVSAEENSLYKTIISDVQLKHFSCVDSSFSSALIRQLRQELQQKYQHDQLKKAAIRNRTNETVEAKIRGDYISGD
jgi:hypothetical protein